MRVEIDKSIGPTLRTIRKVLDISTLEMAKRSGISQSYLSELETGKKSLSLKTLATYCEVLDVQPSEVIAMVEVLNGDKDSLRAFGPKMIAVFNLLEVRGGLEL